MSIADVVSKLAPENNSLSDRDWSAIADARARGIKWRQIWEAFPEPKPYKNLNAFMGSAYEALKKVEG